MAGDLDVRRGPDRLAGVERRGDAEREFGDRVQPELQRRSSRAARRCRSGSDGTWNSSNPVPASFSVNGVTCGGGNPTTSPTPTPTPTRVRAEHPHPPLTPTPHADVHVVAHRRPGRARSTAPSPSPAPSTAGCGATAASATAGRRRARTRCSSSPTARPCRTSSSAPGRRRRALLRVVHAAERLVGGRRRGRRHLPGQRRPELPRRRRRRPVRRATRCSSTTAPGTLTVQNFQATNFGTFYRSCGNCSTQHQRDVVLRNVTLTRPGNTVAGINVNLRRHGPVLRDHDRQRLQAGRW